MVRLLAGGTITFLAIAGLVGACASTSPPANTIEPADAPSKAPYTLAPSPPSQVPIASGAAGPPGRPYVAGDLAELMKGAPRGFPDQLRTQATSEAFATRMWSFDGQPFRTVWFDGSCESGRCELSATGLPAFASTVDAIDTFTLVLDQASGIYSEPSPPTLRGFPQDLVATLDSKAPALDGLGQLKTKPLLGAEWLIPPPDAAFALRYGNGDEELDPTLIVVYSRSMDRILSITNQP